MYKNLVIVVVGSAGTRAAQLLEHTLPPDSGTHPRAVPKK